MIALALRRALVQRLLSAAAVLGCATSLQAQSSAVIGGVAKRPATPALVTLEGLGQGVVDFTIGKRVVAWTSREVVLQLDLNDDGDMLDHVLYVHDRVTGITRNTGLAISRVNGGDKRLLQDEDVIMTLVSEDDAGQTDLNGDGDASDGVVQFVDGITGAITNTGLARRTTADQMDLEGGLFAVIVDEFAQGLDLDGDGQLGDFVTFAGSVATGVSTALPFTTNLLGRLAVLEGHVVVAAHESSSGVDWTQDGDLLDYVLAVHDIARGTSTLLPGAIGAGFQELEGDLLVYAVEDGSIDRNGDGDALDIVPGFLDLANEVFVPFGPASNAGIARDGDLLAFAVSEPFEGVDLNGDGDVLDLVLHVVDLSTATVTNVGLATDYTLPEMRDGRVAFMVPESAQGLADLNFDGGVGDGVPHVYDAASNTTLNTHIAAVGVLRLLGDSLACTVSEHDQAATDLNGDGDAADAVLHVVDLPTGRAVNRRLACTSALLDTVGGAFTFVVEESSQGQDLLGDGDLFDNVRYVLDEDTGALISLGLGMFGPVPMSGPDTLGAIVGFLASEPSSGDDLDGDGDASDVVLVLATVKG